MLILTRRGDDLVVCASNGGHPSPPAWYLNLSEDGEAEVRVGTMRWSVSAREAAGEERAQCWKVLIENYPDFESYQKLTARLLPVMVLERTEETS
jgi:deazaflavin-dependent oxidoreductase (nitroreductase family)